jgi:hypothetical protein
VVRERRRGAESAALALAGAAAAALVVGLAAPAFWPAAGEQVAYWARFGGRVWHLDPATPREWAILWGLVAVQAAAFGAIAATLRDAGVAAALRDRSVLALLLALSVLAVRMQLNRGDGDHLRMAAVACALVALALAATRWRERVAALPASARTVATVALLALGAVAVGRGPAPRGPLGLAEKLRSIAATDAEVVQPEHRDAARAVAPALDGSSCFYTLTSEGSWYAVLGKPSCSRFHQLVYARTDAAQREVVASLERARPAVILVENAFWSNAIDGVPTRVSHPVVWEYVREAYEPSLTIGSQEFWRRKGAASSR